MTRFNLLKPRAFIRWANAQMASTWLPGRHKLIVIGGVDCPLHTATWRRVMW